MIDLSNLAPAKGSHKKKKKVGRGHSSGHGKTSCRGHKGQKSRAGGGKGIRFEGGQTPLYRRLPKMGTFKNYPFRQEYNLLNVCDLMVFDDGANLKIEDLKNRFFSKSNRKNARPVKIVGSGELTKKIIVEANKFSKEAVIKIEAAKGKAVTI